MRGFCIQYLIRWYNTIVYNFSEEATTQKMTGDDATRSPSVDNALIDSTEAGNEGYIRAESRPHTQNNAAAAAATAVISAVAGMKRTQSGRSGCGSSSGSIRNRLLPTPVAPFGGRNAEWDQKPSVATATTAAAARTGRPLISPKPKAVLNQGANHLPRSALKPYNTAIFYSECHLAGISPKNAERAVVDASEQYQRWWVEALRRKSSNEGVLPGDVGRVSSSGILDDSSEDSTADGSSHPLSLRQLSNKKLRKTQSNLSRGSDNREIREEFRQTGGIGLSTPGKKAKKLPRSVEQLSEAMERPECGAAIDMGDLVKSIVAANRNAAAAAHKASLAAIPYTPMPPITGKDQGMAGLEESKENKPQRTNEEWTTLARQVTGLADALYVDPTEAPSFAYNEQNNVAVGPLVREHVRAKRRKLHSRFVELGTEFVLRKQIYDEAKADEAKADAVSVAQEEEEQKQDAGGRSSNPYRRARRGDRGGGSGIGVGDFASSEYEQEQIIAKITAQEQMEKRIKLGGCALPRQILEVEEVRSSLQLHNCCLQHSASFWPYSSLHSDLTHLCSTLSAFRNECHHTLF